MKSYKLLSIILIGSFLPLHGECQSCKTRSASQRDNLAEGSYYEDTPYYYKNLKACGNDEDKQGSAGEKEPIAHPPAHRRVKIRRFGERHFLNPADNTKKDCEK